MSPAETGVADSRDELRRLLGTLDPARACRRGPAPLPRRQRRPRPPRCSASPPAPSARPPRRGRWPSCASRTSAPAGHRHESALTTSRAGDPRMTTTLQHLRDAARRPRRRSRPPRSRTSTPSSATEGSGPSASARPPWLAAGLAAACGARRSSGSAPCRDLLPGTGTGADAGVAGRRAAGSVDVAAQAERCPCRSVDRDRAHSCGTSPVRRTPTPGGGHRTSLGHAGRGRPGQDDGAAAGTRSGPRCCGAAGSRFGLVMDAEALPAWSRTRSPRRRRAEAPVGDGSAVRGVHQRLPRGLRRAVPVAGRRRRRWSGGPAGPARGRVAVRRCGCPSCPTDPVRSHRDARRPSPRRRAAPMHLHRAATLRRCSTSLGGA